MEDNIENIENTKSTKKTKDKRNEENIRNTGDVKQSPKSPSKSRSFLIFLSGLRSIINFKPIIGYKFWERIKHHEKNKKLFLGILLILVFLVFLVVLLAPFFRSNSQSVGQALDQYNQHNQRNQDETKPSAKASANYLGEQLNDISLKLANIENHLSGNNAIVNLDPIREQLSQLTVESKQLAQQSSELISKQIQAATTELENRLAIIKSQLVKFQAEQERIAYVSPQNLPFRVKAIDNIQQVNVVTVSYNHTVFPLDIGDYLAGWKLISADFANQKAEFINNKDQHVLIDINRTISDKEEGSK